MNRHHGDNSYLIFSSTRKNLYFRRQGTFWNKKKILLRVLVYFIYLYPVHTQSIFRNKRFVLNEMSKRNASKLYEMKNKKYCMVFPAHKIQQAFGWSIFFSSRNLLFLKSVLHIQQYYIDIYVPTCKTWLLGPQGRSPDAVKRYIPNLIYCSYYFN